eukprot:jgi/Mesvir1/6542/Mv16803-RA.1
MGVVKLRPQHRSTTLLIGSKKRSPGITVAGLFWGKEEKELEQYTQSDKGQAVLQDLDAAANRSADPLAAGLEILEKHGDADSGSKGLIPGSVRLLIATTMNKLIDIPIIDEEQEQVLFLKFVDVLANYVEEKVKITGIPNFGAMTEAERQKWKDNMVKAINEKVNLPVLNEAAEAVLIGYALEMLLAHLAGKKDGLLKGLAGKVIGKLFG